VNFDLQDVKNLVDTFDPERPTGDPFLDARYEAHRAIFGHGQPYWRMFYHLTDLLKPAFTVELGAWQATCAAHMASGYQYGDVLTIDHHTDPGDEENKLRAQEAAAQYDNLHYLQGWTWDVVGNVAAYAMGADILFVDSWHHYKQAMRDWSTYNPLLSPVALVVCDDLVNAEPTLHRMEEFWRDISGPYESFVNGSVNPGFPMGFMRFTR